MAFPAASKAPSQDLQDLGLDESGQQPRNQV